VNILKSGSFIWQKYAANFKDKTRTKNTASNLNLAKHVGVFGF
jgi:hypothetical protein